MQRVLVQLLTGQDLKIGDKKKIIVIGGGTAGSVVAKKLSHAYNVMVLDKGSRKKIPIIYRVPLLIGLLFKKNTEYVNKTKLKFSNKRDVPFFESNLIGGASIINGCVHVLGNTKSWANSLKKFNLTIDSLYESYERLFTKTKEIEKINLSEAKERELDTLFFASLSKFNVDRGNVEWTDLTTCGMIYNTVKGYFRSSVINLNPFASSKLIDRCKVERLVINAESKVIGVYDGKKIHKADYVVFCAGVISTNSILLREAVLVDDGTLVDLRIDAGRKVKDHTNLRVNVLANKKIESLNEINSKFYLKLILAFKHLIGINTLMRGTGASASANLDIDNDGVVDTRINLLKFSEVGRMGSDGKLFSSPLPGFSVSITHINPKSEGSIDLTNGVVDLKINYLTNRDDINHIKQSLQFVIELLESEPLGEVVEHIVDIETIASDPEGYVLNNSYSGYHLIGGCAHLVGSDFDVHNYDNVFVCDASIISEYPSSNIHSSVVLLADLFSEKFLQKYRTN